MPPAMSKFGLVASLCLCLCLVLISACQPIRQPLTSKDQDTRLNDKPRWRASGKISLRYQNESSSASFTWQQDHFDYKIHLFGPFGQGSVRLRKEHQQVTLTSAKSSTQTASSAEQLMEDNLGWQVPVSNMVYWIRGLPAPKTPIGEVRFDDQGFLQSLEQQGWRLEIRRRERFGVWTLPAKLVATRDGVRILMVIKEWRFESTRKR